jgi:hypothetical protein
MAIKKEEGDTRCRPFSLFALKAPAAAGEERQAERSQSSETAQKRRALHFFCFIKLYKLLHWYKKIWIKFSILLPLMRIYYQFHIVPPGRSGENPRC